MRRRLVIAACGVWASTAHADLAKPVAARAQLDGPIAKITVRYALDLSIGETDDKLPIASRAIVTGAIIRTDGVDHRLALDAAVHASATFAAIGDADGGPHRAWAVNISALEAGQTGGVRLQLDAPRAARVLIDLEMSAPTCFVRDVRYLRVPETWKHVLSAPVATRDESAVNNSCVDADSDFVNDKNVWLALPANELATKPFGDQRIGTFGSRLALGTHDIARVEIDLSREISQVAPDLYTAIVIDGSRSVDDEQRAAQRAIVASYLRAAPKSRVQVIEFDRKARVLLPAWTTATDAAVQVARELAVMTVHNGSNLDRGLAEAATWLGRINGTRRIILFTDELMAKRLADIPPASLQAALPAGTLVHVVVLASDKSATLDRDDDALLAPLAQATEGMAVYGHRDERGLADATKLVRPIALEKLTVDAPGWELQQSSPTEDACNIDGDLDEGTACSWWGLGTGVSGPVRVDGMLWGHHVVRVVRPDPSQGRSIARVLSAIGRATGFDNVLMRQIDHAAYAVNAAWSLFGTWGGHDGYADLQGDLGLSTIGTSSHDGVGRAIDSGVGTGRTTTAIDLKPQLLPALEKCSIGDAHFEIDVELTHEEIVDVAVKMQPGDAVTLHDCVEDAVWATMVTLPHAQLHATTKVVF